MICVKAVLWDLTHPVTDAVLLQGLHYNLSQLEAANTKMMSCDGTVGGDGTHLFTRLRFATD